MPIYLRKWYIRKLIEVREDEQKQMNKQMKQNNPKKSSKFNPSHITGGDGAISIFPAPDTGGADSYKIYYVNETPVNNNDVALTYADSYINYFPANKVYLIVIYAAIKSLEAKMAEYAVEEEDLELVQAIASNLSSLKQQYDTAFNIMYPKEKG